MELAIQKDCEAIIEGFIANENPRFESFVYQWTNTKFYHIYTALTHSGEIIQCTNACMHLAKRVLANKDTLPSLGALFLLYAVYFKQPTYRYHKIDIDMNAWIKLKEFINGLDSMHQEARCVFLELAKEEAFRFVASDVYVGLENLVNLDKIRINSISLSKTVQEFQQDVKALTCQRGLFSGMEKLDDGYSEMKEMMNQSSSTGSIIPASKSFDELRDALKSLSELISKTSLMRKKSKKNKAKKGGVSKAKQNGMSALM